MQPVEVLIVKAAETAEAAKIVKKVKAAKIEKEVKNWIKTMHICKIYHLTSNSFC